MTFYSVIRYVPDIFAGEFINIGVIVWGDGVVHSKFIEDWRRAKTFGRRDPAALKDFARWVESDLATASLGFEGEQRFSEKVARDIAGHWGGIIQLTEPRPSMLTSTETLKSVARRFLRDVDAHSETAHDRDARDDKNAPGGNSVPASPGSTGSFSSPYAGDFENETNNSHASAYVGVVDKPVEPGEPAAPPAQRSASVLEGKRGDGGALEADGHGQTSELPVVPACAGMSRERRFWRSPSQGGPRVRGDEPPIDERIRAAGMDGIEEVSKAVNAEVARQNSLPEGQSR